ncbi:MAG: fused MFS/spermidine synthase [Chloroflexi bacterium]|nr:fused MFS/spermidine synthase [Chloroflexota bacterium]
MVRSDNIWIANFIVFVSSACGLVIELVAGRMMAPYVGVSLYTWTSIIGVVLAGISLGNYLGGKIADRWASHATLGIQLLLSGILSLSILLSINVMIENLLPFQLPLPAKVLTLTAVIFFLPSCVLGTISPVVVKLTLQNLAEAGNIVGRIYAFSALGSIVGTFATGFILIAMMGTRAIVFAVAVVLVIMALVFGDWRKVRIRFAVLLLAFAAFSYFLIGDGALESRFLKETNYFSIRVGEKSIGDGKVVKELILDHLIHSYSLVDDPTHLEYGYEKIYAEITRYLIQSKSDLATLFIGGGGYTYPRYLEAVYPDVSIDVLEIDPGVTETAQEHLGLRPDTKIRTFNGDARLYFIEKKADRKYDLVMGDAFNDLSLPYHLTTLEFNEQVKGVMNPDGYYMINVIDDYKKGEFMRAYLNTLKQTFRHVYLMGLGRAWEWDGSSTYIVLAGDKPFDMEEFPKVATDNGQTTLTAAIMPQDQLEDFLGNRGKVVLLTDDYAPIDNMMAPRFIDRGY